MAVWEQIEIQMQTIFAEARMVYLLPNLKNNCIFKTRAEGEGLNFNSMPRAEGEGINSNLHPEPKARV